MSNMVLVYIKYIFFVLLIFLPLEVFSQERQTTVLDRMLFSSAIPRLEEAIFETAQRHSIYSYNLANATTPGFEPILFEDDQTQLLKMVPKNSEYFSKIIVEHMSSRMAVNRTRQQAYYALYKKMFDNYKQVATLGKK